MEIFWCIVLLVLGLIIIIKCGDWFVDAASWFAEISGIPKLIVGATIVSLATTLPELLVSLFAAISAKTQGNPELVDMAIGNAVGSVTANTGLILAIALICIPTVIKRSEYALKSILLICASLVIALFGKFFNGILASICLLIIFIIAMSENIFMAIKNTKKERELHLEDITKKIPEKSRKNIFINVLKFITGAIGIVVGAELLKNNGQTLAEMCGVPTRIISVTIIAIGTSLPEFVTTITAIIKKQASLSAGNIIGANIIDLTLILPICSLIYGGTLPMTGAVSTIDLPACFIVTIVALIPTLITRKFSKIQGIILLILYVCYVILTSVI
jgi:cation:H+ antiporter